MKKLVNLERHVGVSSLEHEKKASGGSAVVMLTGARWQPGLVKSAMDSGPDRVISTEASWPPRSRGDHLAHGGGGGGRREPIVPAALASFGLVEELELGRVLRRCEQVYGF